MWASVAFVSLLAGVGFYQEGHIGAAVAFITVSTLMFALVT